MGSVAQIGICTTAFDGSCKNVPFFRLMASVRGLNCVKAKVDKTRSAKSGIHMIRVIRQSYSNLVTGYRAWTMSIDNYPFTDS
jgi:hypothetical protein